MFIPSSNAICTKSAKTFHPLSNIPRPKLELFQPRTTPNRGAKQKLAPSNTNAIYVMTHEVLKKLAVPDNSATAAPWAELLNETTKF